MQVRTDWEGRADLLRLSARTLKLCDSDWKYHLCSIPNTTCHISGHVSIGPRCFLLERTDYNLCEHVPQLDRACAGSVRGHCMGGSECPNQPGSRIGHYLRSK